MFLPVFDDGYSNEKMEIFLLMFSFVFVRFLMVIIFLFLKIFFVWKYIKIIIFLKFIVT
jgi:hypothetical protein